MKHYSITLLLFLSSLISLAQSEIKGVVKDAASGETIVGASVIIEGGKNAQTDIDGKFSIAVADGNYTVIISYVGFETQKIKVKVAGKPATISISLTTKTLNEVEIVSDVAKTRETPVAFSTISTKQLQEELNSRDLAMILNSTPGAYATESGGGSGDARVNIRGFDQRNVAVLVDGVPVNDMENGWVYWSNWDGLGDVTRNMQVQRGLGASKLAIASVGGTMNIITKGIDNKKEIFIKQEVMSDLMYKTSIGFNTGQLKGGWGLTGAVTAKKGDGYIEQTWDEAYSYFLKVQKRMGKHLISLSGSGAPQKHGQRATGLQFANYDRDYAKDVLGVNADSILNASQYTDSAHGDLGRRYNPHWGYLDGKPYNERVNYFHKPQINLSHFYTINDKLYLSTVAYASFGSGGGTKLVNTVYPDKNTGHIDFDALYSSNASNINGTYSMVENVSTNIIQSSVNKHNWYGLLSSLNYKIDSAWTTTFGIDGRYYKGLHYKEVYDLLGGDYYENHSDQNQPYGTFPNDPNFQYQMKRVGDKIFTNYEGEVMWGGAFAQAEFKKKSWTAFVTASISETGYKRKDYYKNKDLVLADTTILQAVGFGDVYTYNGNQYTYTSPEAKTSETKRKWYLGYTFKAGSNYNINEHQQVFINAGYLKMAPKFDLVFTSSNYENPKAKMQEVLAVELGYGFHQRIFAANLNLYYTDWQNKPLSEFPTIRYGSNDYYYTTDGLHEVHKGIELDFIYKGIKNLDVEGLASIGDWTVQSAGQVNLYDPNTDALFKTLDFSAKGVHVGDAAQIQLGGSLRYEIIKNLYIKARYTYFTKNYSKYNLTDLQLLVNTFTGVVTDNRDRESWLMPSYGLLDVFAGYNFKLWKLNMNVNGGVTNLLNTIYIADAQNNYTFDARSATGYIGMGTRFNLGLKIAF